jgi:hypothetical protein
MLFYVTLFSPLSTNSFVQIFKQAFPSYYAKNYLGRVPNMYLQVHGQKYAVRFDEGPQDKRLRSGWKKFVQDNNLKIGDICLFELLSNQRIRTMEVYITPVNGGNLSISRTADVAEFPDAGNGLSGGTASCWLVNR